MNPTEILELKNAINEMKNAIEGICSRVDQMRDRISDRSKLFWKTQPNFLLRLSGLNPAAFRS